MCWCVSARFDWLRHIRYILMYFIKLRCRIALIGQVDCVSYRSMMGSDTTALNPLWASVLRQRVPSPVIFPGKRSRWISSKAPRATSCLHCTLNIWLFTFPLLITVFLQLHSWGAVINKTPRSSNLSVNMLTVMFSLVWRSCRVKKICNLFILMYAVRENDQSSSGAHSTFSPW